MVIINAVIGASTLLFVVWSARLIARVSERIAEWDEHGDCGCNSREEMVDITEHDD